MARTPIKAPQSESLEVKGEPVFDPDELFTPESTPDDKTIDALFGNIDSIKQAKEVLSSVRAVPTRFPIFNWGSKVGGLPLERFIVVHGPSSHGKTAFCHGLGESFIRRGHIYNLIDAEYTTPFEWTRSLMGDAADSSRFRAMRPKTYEETVMQTRLLLTNMIQMKKKGTLDKSIGCLIVVDSVRKLIPENILKKLSESLKKEELVGGVDGFSGRAAQIKAAMNAAWLDELVPMLAEAGATMIAIARESENTSTDLFKTDWKMTGGKALEFDSSLIMRIERDAWIKRGDKEESEILGERHRITIRKTKVGGKDGKGTIAYFHTANGVDAPEGFDKARDIFYLAKKFNIIKQSGAWYACDLNGQEYRWHGEQKVLETLREFQNISYMIEEQARAMFTTQEVEVDNT